MTRPTGLSLVTGMLVLGCGMTRLDAGSDPDPGEDVEGHVWSGAPSNSYAIPCDAPAPDWLAGTWEGQFDSYALPSGSSAVRVDVQGLQDGGWLCGTMVFGMGAPLPLPTDPKAPPPGVAKASDYGKVYMALMREGFPYELLSMDTAHHWPPLVDQRVRFMINLAESYKAWCNMQPAYSWTDQADIDNTFPGAKSPIYTCLSPGKRVWVDESPYCDGMLAIGRDSCAQVAYCDYLKLCDCYGRGSTSAPNSTWDDIGDGCTATSYDATPLDLTVTDATMAGSVVFRNRIEGMHLTRVP